MNPVKGWKMAASFVFIAAIAVVFGYAGKAQSIAAVEPAAISLPADATPAPAKQAEPPSNEIPEFQQLD